MNVLIVDDQPVNRTLPVVLLRQRGFAVREAASGEEALAALAAGEPCSVLLLDVSMPGLSGTEVCRRLRADPVRAGLRIIAYTAHAMPGEQAEILAAGFDAILTKPINRQRLFEALEIAG